MEFVASENTTNTTPNAELFNAPNGNYSASSSQGIIWDVFRAVSEFSYGPEYSGGSGDERNLAEQLFPSVFLRTRPTSRPTSPPTTRPTSRPTSQQELPTSWPAQGNLPATYDFTN